MKPLASPLDLEALRRGYASGEWTPSEVVEEVLARIAAEDPMIWITLLPRAALLERARALEQRGPRGAPLYGVPFAIKDNIDLAGVPTTAGCPAYTYMPERSAAVVERLIAAGAIAIGKTNLDQFATGLVGVRSPYGTPRNSFDASYIPGGSSSGSAVAVAKGLASFALGTDTAGSGRVPAAFSNVVGLKPTRGVLSARGVVPACRSLDCVSIFALAADDAAEVFEVSASYDPEDPFARRCDAQEPSPVGRLRFGVPRSAELEFFGNREAAGLFAAAVERMRALGGECVEIDLAPFREVARMLYEGPWLAERYAVVRELLERRPDALHPVTRSVIAAGGEFSAADAFAADFRLRALARSIEPVWSDVDVLLLPTAGTIYRIAEIEADPIRRNMDLGYYTNFVNLLDLCAVAVPAGFQSNGLPFGVSLIAPPLAEGRLLDLAGRLHHAAAVGQGATGHPLPAPRARGWMVPQSERMAIAVCGAHMSGLPLNRELASEGGRLLACTTTAPRYRLFALAGGPPLRPGLVRVPDGGASIELEVWELPVERAGRFLARVPPPLAIGSVELADGTWVKGFVCETYAVELATDITRLGGWRAYLAA